MKIVVRPNSESSSRNNLVTAKPKSQNVLWSRLPIVSWKRATGGGVNLYFYMYLYLCFSCHLLPWLKKFAEQSVTHWTEAKLEGADKKDEGDDDEDAVGQQLVEVGIAKDQALRVGGDPKYSGKYYCSDAHSRGTKYQKDFPEKSGLKYQKTYSDKDLLTCPACLLQTFEDRSR